MELLRPDFVLKNNVKNITPAQNTQVNPNFKAGKADIGKELGDYVLKSLNTSSIKDTFNNPKKRETFLQTLGSIIVSTAAALTNILTNSENKEDTLIETPERPVEPIMTEEKAEEENIQVVKSNIAFKTPRGKKPQIESDYINFVNEKFGDNEAISDKLKLLFNEYCGINRNNKHALNNEVVDNKTLIPKIFVEIKENADDIEKLDNVITGYLSFAPVINVMDLMKQEVLQEDIIKEEESAVVENTKIKLDEQPVVPEIKISEAEKQKELEQKLDKIKTIFSDESIDISPKTVTKATSVLKKQFPDDIEQIELVFEKLATSNDKKIFIVDLANKMVSNEAVKDFANSELCDKIDFRLYNGLKKAGVKNENIKKIAEFLMLQYAKEIDIINDDNDFNVKITDDYSINNKFKKITTLFGLIKSQEITLTSNDKAELDGNDIIDELKKDYYRNNNRTKYKNLVGYIYGKNHRIYDESNFDTHIYENRLKYLLDIVNNEKVFNSGLFSNHSKLRFIERFVLSENFGTKKFENATREKVRMFIETLKRELMRGITVSSYYADDDMEKVGAQIRFQNPENENIIITLNSQGKMQTII